jgi:hypothetical protein
MKGLPLNVVDAFVLSVCSWSTPNDLWLSESLLGELAVIMSIRCVIDFLIGIYIN